jgi:hypothetical protein
LDKVSILVKENNMKRGYIILLILLMGLPQLHAQSPSEKIASFREVVLPKYNVYFSNAELGEKGQLTLSAIEKYNLLSIVWKKAVMDNLIKTWQESLVVVQYDTKRELWGWDSETGKALFLERWDISATATTKTTTATVSKTAMHPFFVYFGGQGQLDKNHEANAAFNSRVGFFLLRNRWDLAWTFSGGLLGNIDSEEPMTSQFSTGLMSKVYFPIKKLNISPNVGLDIASTAYSTSGTTGDTYNRSASFLAGISWYIGHGSLDVGFRIGKEFTTMVGYTYIPQFNKRKRK